MPIIRIKKRKKTFVLVIPSFEDIFNAFYAGEIIKGASMAASRLKIDILIHITNRFDHRGWLDATLLDRRYIDGIIFGDIDNDVSVVEKAITRGIPTLVLNNHLEEPISCVAIDNHQAAQDVVEHFIKLGHRNIATIAGDLSTQAGKMRLDGFHAALKKAGISVPLGNVAQGDFLRTSARAASIKLLKLKECPTAVFAASDVMAFELIDVARANNLNIPDDISVVGFDDNPLNVNSSVRLTTVAQPLMEMGRLGVENLVQMSNAQVPLPLKIMLPAKLVVRSSTGPCMERKG